jgi:hypothetical protein
MSQIVLAKYLSPWSFRRNREHAERVEAIRKRDGDNCRRCRRPLRFDLPHGHERAPKLEPIGPETEGEPQALENLCLTHARCIAAGANHTEEVTERVRRKNEAELFGRRSRSADSLPGLLPVSQKALDAGIG